MVRMRIVEWVGNYPGEAFTFCYSPLTAARRLRLLRNRKEG